MKRFPLPLTAIAMLIHFAAHPSLLSCAHVDSKVQPIVITGHMLDVAGMTFESVEAGMRAASERQALTREQVLAWNDFLERWRVGYKASAAAWREAKTKLDKPAAEQAASLLTSLLSELATWQLVVAGGA